MTMRRVALETSGIRGDELLFPTQANITIGLVYE